MKSNPWPFILVLLVLSCESLPIAPQDDQGVVAVLNDPVGAEISVWNRPNGLEIKKVRVPIGVIGIVFESRPNVTCDAAALCFKTSNAVILRGGKEPNYDTDSVAVAEPPWPILLTMAHCHPS